MDLTPRTEQIVRKMFAPAEQAEVIEYLINDCGDNLEPHVELIERIRLGVLMLSRGDMERLIVWIVEAQTDWRDLLMAADFGHDIYAHLKWSDSYLAE